MKVTVLTRSKEHPGITMMLRVTRIICGLALLAILSVFLLFALFSLGFLLYLTLRNPKDAQSLIIGSGLALLWNFRKLIWNAFNFRSRKTLEVLFGAEAFACLLEEKDDIESKEGPKVALEWLNNHWC